MCASMLGDIFGLFLMCRYVRAGVHSTGDEELPSAYLLNWTTMRIVAFSSSSSWIRIL